MKFFITTLFLGISCFSYSQGLDSTGAVQINTDTVIIIEEPVVVTKTVYVQKKTEKPITKLSAYYLSFNATGSVNKDHYDVCPTGDCEAYFDRLKQTTHPYLNNSYELSLSYSPSSIYTELGLSYSIYRDKFSYTDLNNGNHEDLNKYQYLDINLGSGYWFKKKKRALSLLVLGGISASKLLSASGTTLSKKNSDSIVSLTDQVQLFDYAYRVYAKVKVLYKLSDRWAVQIGIDYAYDLRSIKTSDIYIRQRNVFGLTAGLMYNF
ncbi:MAG: hypothetical protein JWM14_1024 [Chitinophagaceae bacterium]|nr:hypothetical protein [Chitinophagaceae bacterium]